MFRPFTDFRSQSCKFSFYAILRMFYTPVVSRHVLDTVSNYERTFVTVLELSEETVVTKGLTRKYSINQSWLYASTNNFYKTKKPFSTYLLYRYLVMNSNTSGGKIKLNSCIHRAKGEVRFDRCIFNALWSANEVYTCK